MPKSNTHHVSPGYPLSQSRHHPHANPTSDPAGRNVSIYQSTIVPFEQIKVGQFYNCCISFTPLRPGGRVPGTIPKHRVLVTRVETYNYDGQQSVEYFYLTTLGGQTPAIFHGKGSVKQHMYLPFAPAEIPGYLSLESDPPVMCGYLHFAQPLLVDYAKDLRGSRKLRHAPGGSGIQIPLRHGPIVVGGSGLQYAGEMKLAWQGSMGCQNEDSGKNWAARAQQLLEKFSEQKEVTMEEGDEGDEEEEEWGGITGVGFFLLFFSSFFFFFASVFYFP